MYLPYVLWNRIKNKRGKVNVRLLRRIYRKKIGLSKQQILRYTNKRCGWALIYTHMNRCAIAKELSIDVGAVILFKGKHSCCLYKDRAKAFQNLVKRYKEIKNHRLQDGSYLLSRSSLSKLTKKVL